MGRTLTATFTFVSDIFVHFSLPPCLCAELSVCSLWIPDKKPGFLPEKKGSGLYLNNPERVQTSRRKDGNMFIVFPLYPSGFASCANPVFCCSSPRQHPHRHLPLGARLLSSGRLETVEPERGGKGVTHRAAHRWVRLWDGKCEAVWQVDLRGPTTWQDNLKVEMMRGGFIQKEV